MKWQHVRNVIKKLVRRELNALLTLENALRVAELYSLTEVQTSLFKSAETVGTNLQSLCGMINGKADQGHHEMRHQCENDSDFLQ
ncbi:hypothetical protein Mal35_00810 [Gimesia maris]|nr:hypothetical protein Mal35_00810 [Gimesia maris]